MIFNGFGWHFSLGFIYLPYYDAKRIRFDCTIVYSLPYKLSFSFCYLFCIGEHWNFFFFGFLTFLRLTIFVYTIGLFTRKMSLDRGHSLRI